MEHAKLKFLGIGDEIELAENWTFNLVKEGRNDTFSKRYGVVWKILQDAQYEYNRVYEPAQVTLLKGMILKVSRVYIKNGQKDYESITFSLVPRDKDDLKGRFWVSLSEANKIVYVVK